VVAPLIEKNTTIPVSRSQVFTTAADNQTQVEVHVIQGERPLAKDNKSLGQFVLDGIPPAPRGVPQIEVTFDIDANGILNVTAKDKATGRSQSIVIKGATGLSEEEVERMRAEAEAHAEEDRRQQELIEAKNKAENAVYTAEKTIKDLGEKVKPAEKEAVEEKIKSLQELLKQEKPEKEEVEKRTNGLLEELQKISQEAYQAGQAPNQGDGGKETSDQPQDETGKKSDAKGEDEPEEGKVVS